MLIIIRGLPGSGKSTLAKKLNCVVHVEADMYFINESGEYVFSPEKLPDAHKWCQETTRNLLNSGKSVVVSNTFTRIWEMQAYLDMARDLSCTVKVIRKNGCFGNVHDVPEKTIEAMRERFEDFPGEEEV